MCVVATINKSHRKRIESIANSASKVRVPTTHSGRQNGDEMSIKIRFEMQ